MNYSPEKHIFRAEIKFVIVILMDMRPISTTKDLEEGIGRTFMEKSLRRCLHLNGATRNPIY
jgi:hypothetical protein